jgi:hypothetical protein
MEGRIVKTTFGFYYKLRKGDDTALGAFIITDKTLCNELANHKAMKNNSHFRTIDKDIEADVLFRAFDMLAASVATVSKALAAFINVMGPFYDQRIKEIKATKGVRFWDLWYVFPKARDVIVTQRDSPMGAVIKSARYEESIFFVGYRIECSFIQTNGVQFGKSTLNITIALYEGVRSIEKLALAPLAAKAPRRKALAARGKMFVEMAHKASHLHYEGDMYTYSYWKGEEKTHVRDRVMVDTVAFREYDSNYGVFMHNRTGSNNYDDYDEEDRTGVKTAEALDEKYYWMTWPTLPAFCLTTKQWGEVLIDKLKPIEFRSNAFDQLVLAASVKRTIRSIVEMQMERRSELFADIIDGKGSGAIFLLYGPPGVGKTSSAEAIAEERRCPLYSVTVGELGTNAKDLEAALERVLKTAARWNSVILLDEADIFLEKRTASDVKRNAMVSIFLRLLEYHTGVLFMTTNRVQSFDEAFLSRISIGLFYKDFDTPTRAQVWNNLLKAAGSKMVGDTLSHHRLNGRQIRTIIRTASAIALKEKRVMQLTDVKEVVALTLGFVEHMTGVKD